MKAAFFTCGTTMSPLGPLSAPAVDYIQNLFSHKQILLSLVGEFHWNTSLDRDSNIVMK